MFDSHDLSMRLRRVRVSRLALCLSAALVSQVADVNVARAAPSAAASSPLSRIGSQTTLAKSTPERPSASSWPVKNCTDHDTDSLRDIVQNKAQSGDTVDLSQLPTICNARNSTITLTSGEIAIPQAYLALQGPDAKNGTVTISGNHASRVLNHTNNSGTLSLYSLAIADGNYHIDAGASAGCVFSKGPIYLTDTIVTGCVASSDAANAVGGAVETSVVVLIRSTVSDSQAIAPSGQSVAGGIYATELYAYYSSITGNSALGATLGNGGGAQAHFDLVMFGSTVDNNEATTAGGGLLAPLGISIVNSTISGNVAAKGAGLAVGGNSSISNSTIGFNHSSDGNSAAVYMPGQATSTLTLYSTVIADNSAGALNIPADLYIANGAGPLAGADNLVMASNVFDPTVIKLTSDPKLGQLQFNGGRTRTHQLLPGSPGIGQGSQNGLPPWITNEQRGTGYPRWTGPTQSVDIGAVQFDTIFVGGFDLQ